MTHPKLSLYLASSLSLSLVGCQHLTLSQLSHPAVNVTALAANAPKPAADAGESALYEQAVAAIDRRDYGLALDVLQLAREAKDNDPRVLSAMGVVYDKLGRFDLSKRYYDLAALADPGSKVVAIDRAYSMVLQQRVTAEREPNAVVLAETAPLPRLTAAHDAVTLTSTGLAQFAAPHASILGGLQVQNATGMATGVAKVRANLVGKGWTVARRVADAEQVNAVSIIRFPAGAEHAATGLAHTLPFAAKLEVCSDCNVMQLTLGANALRYTRADQAPGARHA